MSSGAPEGKTGKLEDSKEVIKSRKWNKDRQYNDKKKKDKQTNNGPQNTTQLLRKGNQFLLHWWHPSCYC